MALKQTTGKRQEDGFEAVAIEVLRRLRSSLVAVIGQLPGASQIRKPADLQKQLKIDSKLAWQVHRLANAADPVAEAASIPKTRSIRRFLDAAQSGGVNGAIIESAQQALSDLDELITTHAGDYESFESMLCGISESGSEQIDWTHRRAAYKAQSHILGTQARTQLNCYIYNIARDNPDMLDVAMIRGKVNLRRFRREASLLIASIGVSDDEGTQPETILREAIDSGATGEVALLREFCTTPMPGMRSVTGSMGMAHLELADDSVGNKSAVTYVVGDVTRTAVSRYIGPHDKVQVSQAMVRSPVEALILDVAAPVGLFANSPPEVFVYADERSGDAPALGRDHDRLPSRESATHLGRGVDVVHSPDVPRYSEMMKYVFDRLGWDAGKFDIWRCRVEYPVMPSSVVVQFDLPEKAGG